MTSTLLITIAVVLTLFFSLVPLFVLPRSFRAPYVVMLGVLGVGTYFEGVWMERWGWAAARSESLQEFSARLEKLPMVIGQWEGHDEEQDADSFRASHCDKAKSRSYRLKGTNKVVNLYLVSGKARHVTWHTPDWCYRASGYEMQGTPDSHLLKVDMGPNVPEPDALTTVFAKNQTDGMHQLRIFWCFSDDGVWKGPSDPKGMYKQRPALYKVYLITEFQGDNDDKDSNPCVEFARELFPVLNQVLFPKMQSKAVDATAAAKAAT